jgi:transmembrane sensor
MTESKRREIIEAEAIEQLLRLSEPVDHARRAAEFSEWLTRSPRHVEAFLMIVQTWNALDLPSEGMFSSDELIAAARAEPEVSNVVELSRSAEPAPSPRRWSVTRAFRGVAAAAVLAVVAWSGYSNFMASHIYSNDSKEIRHVTLPDGSLVSLNPGSKIRLHWTEAERRLDLSYGRARFHVAKNPQRPFLVDTKFGSVRAVGTIFDVDAQRQETHVTVIEGVVAVDTVNGSVRAPDLLDRKVPTNDPGATENGNIVQLSAGDRAEIVADEANGRVEVNSALVAWTDRRVVFRGATLARVIDEFNRYQSKPVIINDSRLAPLVISGVFDPQNPDSLLSYLEHYEGVQVKRLADGSVLLSSRG